MARFSFLAGFALLAACSAPPPPAPETLPEPVPQVEPSKPALVQPTGAWIDWPITPGDWVYRRDARGSIALFGAAGSDALVTLRCDRQRGRIYIARASAQQSAQFNLRSSARLKQLSARTTAGAKPYVAAEIMPNDPILDALAYSRGRIALETSGEISLALPVWSEIGRIVEDCRR
ncbi:MAG: hypothetical protein V3V15_09630 [Sphingorhabdus sp.]